MKKNVINVLLGAVTIAVGMFLYDFAARKVANYRAKNTNAPSETETN